MIIRVEGDISSFLVGSLAILACKTVFFLAIDLVVLVVGSGSFGRFEAPAALLLRALFVFLGG